jgi:hypothetical protein
VNAWKIAAEERIWGYGISSVFGRQHGKEIVMALGEPHLGEKLEVNLGKVG